MVETFFAAVQCMYTHTYTLTVPPGTHVHTHHYTHRPLVHIHTNCSECGSLGLARARAVRKRVPKPPPRSAVQTEAFPQQPFYRTTTTTAGAMLLTPPLCFGYALTNPLTLVDSSLRVCCIESVGARQEDSAGLREKNRRPTSY